MIPWLEKVANFPQHATFARDLLKLNIVFFLTALFPSMFDFSILKAFSVQVHPPKDPIIKEVIWCSSNSPWIKCNTYGSSLSLAGPTSHGGIFRSSSSTCIGCFVSLIFELTTLFMLSLQESSLL